MLSAASSGRRMADARSRRCCRRTRTPADPILNSIRKTPTSSTPACGIGGGDLPVPAVDPKNRDVVIIASTVSWKSLDGGKTWTALRGAPGGDDYQRPWINPDNPDIIALASDQGAIITVNGGQTWSSWY